jgi:micrococcal nuclease
MYEYKAKVVRVVDGDTLIVDIDLGFCFWARNQTIRLHGIDCPETRSKDKEEVKYGELSKQYVRKFCDICLDEIIIQTEIEDITSGKEKFGRILAVVKKPKTLEVLNDYLIKNNLAVEYYGKNKEEVRAAHLLNRQLLEAKNGFKGEF